MNGHLVLITLGPVQDFIAAARRTRDLWFGSHLLSELGRAAAKAVVDQGGSLIFPALAKGDSELEPCDAPLRATGQPPLNVANKLLAEVASNQDPQALARLARSAVLDRWQDLSEQAQRKAQGLLAIRIDAVWTEQVETFVEFLAAWVEVGSSQNDYRDARRRLEAAIAGRKNLRDFPAWRQQRPGAPPSSLDGARVSVLAEPKHRDHGVVRRHRLGDGEQLDAIGVVKRCGGAPDQFVPIVNVAFASWLAQAQQAEPGLLDALAAACKDIGIARVTRPDLPCAKEFPFDASVLLPSRWKPVFDELGITADPQRWGEQFVRPLLEQCGEPYVACLVADGDRMGATLDTMVSADAHRVFSTALATFPGEARRIVEQDHLGSLVYAGGDDVLAFVPVPMALACARALKDVFGSIMADACAGDIAAPTLSVGLGIGHVMEGMGELLALGRQAERLAKRDDADRGRDRNGLGIIVDKRSGGKLGWRARWGDWSCDPVGRLSRDVASLGETVSTKKVHEIGAIVRRFPKPDGGIDREAGWTKALLGDVLRTLKRSETGGSAPSPTELGLDVADGDKYALAHARIAGWVRRMLIARVFAKAEPKSLRSERAA